MDSFSEIWNLVREDIRASVKETAFNVWLSPLEFVKYENDKITLRINADYKRNVILDKFSTQIRDSVETVFGFPVDIDIILPYGTLFDNYGLLTINSGNFKSSTHVGYYVTHYNQFENRSTGEIIVNNGTFDHNGSSSMFYNRNNLTINDGTFILYGVYHFDGSDHSAYTFVTNTEAGATTNILGGKYGNKNDNPSTYGTLLYNLGTTHVKDVLGELGGLGYNTGTLTIEDSDIVNLHEGAGYTYDNYNTYMYLLQYY